MQNESVGQPQQVSEVGGFHLISHGAGSATLAGNEECVDLGIRRQACSFDYLGGILNVEDK